MRAGAARAGTGGRRRHDRGGHGADGPRAPLQGRWAAPGACPRRRSVPRWLGAVSVGPGPPPGLGARPGGGCGWLRGGSAAAWGLLGLVGDPGSPGSCSEPAPAAAQRPCGVFSQPLGDLGPAALPGIGVVRGLWGHGAVSPASVRVSSCDSHSAWCCQSSDSWFCVDIGL